MFIEDGEHRCEVMAKLQELYDEICKSDCKIQVARNTVKVESLMKDFCRAGTYAFGKSRRSTRRTAAN